ncbi:dihydrodipicolinate synthase family protein [Microlunatus sp. Y2014]|uniref:dihydrodipicolinate synthase family protein n=1 Tax=Microlunatus sp. Y2014 TaxID=3418488 RepID=UPI003DA77164
MTTSTPVPDSAVWAGIFPAALTMFDERGRLDEAATADHLDWLVGQGAHGVFVGGTSGEFVGLTSDERKALFAVAVRAVAGRVPVLVNAGSYATAASIELTVAAREAGVDGVAAVQPYYHRPHRVETLTHFRAVAAANEAPIMIYNIPLNAAVAAVSGDDLMMLYEEGVANAVKNTLPTIHDNPELLARTGPGMRIFYGGFTNGLEALAGGAHGWISGILNVVVPEAVRVHAAVAAGDLAAAREAMVPIMELRRIFSTGAVGQTGDIALWRAVLQLSGRHGGHCRAPLLDLTTEQLTTLERLLPGVGIELAGQQG